MQKNHIFFNCGGRLENFGGVSCEKSRFYAKKSYFFQLRKKARKFLGYFMWKITILRQKIIFYPILGGRVPGAPPPGYGFLFRSEFFFRTTQELEHLFFFPEFNIMLYDKNSELDFFFPPPKSEYFFQQHWESEYFFRKKTITPPSPPCWVVQCHPSIEFNPRISTTEHVHALYFLSHIGCTVTINRVKKSCENQKFNRKE